MAEPFFDCYQQLELAPFAGMEEVRRAWKRLARKYHPDRNPGDPESERRFKALNEAYQLLGDPGRKRGYDEQYSRRTGRARPAEGSATTGGANDARESAGTRRQQGTREAAPRDSTPPPRPRTGPDTRRVIQLPLERFKAGGNIRITFPDGRPDLEFRLPATLAVGEELVLPGKGAPGRHNGPRGRLILEIQPELPAGVSRDGLDLVMELEVDVLDLMLGGARTLAHPDGRSLQIDLPPGVQPGQLVRLKQQGLPGTRKQGDLVIGIKGKVQAARGRKARRYAEKLALQLKRDQQDS